MQVRTCACVAVVLAWGVPAARGEVVVFTSSAAFFQAADIASTENFDSFPARTVLGVGSVSLGGVTFTADNPAATWQTADVIVTSSPPNSLIVMGPPPTVFQSSTLTFDGFTTALGFSLNRGAQPSLFEIVVTTSTGEQFLDALAFDSGSPFGPAYRGYLAEEGLQSIRITPQPVMGVLGNYFLDDVSRGPAIIPEPSSLTLLGVAIGLCGLRRWRSSR